MMHLIPKREGGERPIGLLLSFVRLWERVRKPVLVEWRRTVERHYNWATRGRSAQDSVWRQCLYAEAAHAAGRESAAALIDLTKAYETVPLQVVWESGVLLGLPIFLLRLMLEVFAFARVLVFRGATADAVHTLSAILAGSVFAVDALLLVMIPCCDRVAARHPDVGLSLYVDDVGLQAFGPRGAAASDCLHATKLFIHLVEEKGMTVSRGGCWVAGGKSVVILSRRAREKQAAAGFRAIGLAVVGHARNMGGGLCQRERREEDGD